MKTLLKILSLIGLVLTLLPSFLVFYDVIDMATHFNLMGVGVILWFGSAPFWMKGPSLE
ncbi:hypothetical protein [Marinoscillum sp. MHG1-6]|uniref:hypothetical protein n=1 Tax=Marinoscillum sp. MHG1-6 TaxID=2959627 RepID=UPI002156FEC8|nr:hypothetical protein [Marinoscillum sp. MHG1-6]